MKTFLSLLSLFLFATGLVDGAVEVVPFRVEESRSVKLQDDGVGRQEPQLKLVLSLTGPEAETSVRYGDLKIDEAVDDAGASLIPKKDDFRDAGKFKEYENAFFRKNNFGGKKPAAPQIELDLVSPKRTATKIARLRGTLSLAEAGTVQSIELSGLNVPGQKKLPVPAAANVTITATIEAGSKAHSIGIEISGDENAVESVEVLDDRGKKVSTGMSSWSFGNGPAHRSIDLDQPLDEKMKLVAKIAMDRKITKVSFDLKDIPLP